MTKKIHSIINVLISKKDDKEKIEIIEKLKNKLNEQLEQLYGHNGG